MSLPTRRRLLRAMTTAPMVAVLTSIRASAQVRLRLLLNSGYSSVNAWFCLADDRGYLRDAGLTLEFTAGRGAYTAAGRTADEGFDIGYGDVNALVEQVAASNPRAPLAVYMMFNRSPSVVAVPATGSIRAPRDLTGRHLRGHATDVALQTFPALTMRAGIDAKGVRISTTEDGMGTQATAMLRGDIDGIFGYESTITAALITAGIPVERVRFLFFRDVVPELYGSALMASRQLVREQPKLVAGLVRAINHGVADAVAEPDAAIAAVRARVPTMVERAERARLERTLQGEMSHPESATLGIGAIDATRFAAGIQLLCTSKALAKVPSVTDVFSTAFPVPARERITGLASRL